MPSVTHNGRKPRFVNTAPLSTQQNSPAWKAYFQNITATLDWSPQILGMTYTTGTPEIVGTGFRLSSMLFFSVDVSESSFSGTAGTTQLILPVNSKANGFAMVFDGDLGWKIGDAFIPMNSNICYLPTFVSSNHLAIVGQYQIVATPGT